MTDSYVQMTNLRQLQMQERLQQLSDICGKKIVDIVYLRHHNSELFERVELSGGQVRYKDSRPRLRVPLAIAEDYTMQVLSSTDKPLLPAFVDNVALWSNKPHPCIDNIFAGVLVKHGNRYGYLGKSADKSADVHAEGCAIELAHYTDWWPTGVEHTVPLSRRTALHMLDDDYACPRIVCNYGEDYDTDVSTYGGHHVQWAKDPAIVLDDEALLIPEYTANYSGNRLSYQLAIRKYDQYHDHNVWVIFYKICSDIMSKDGVQRWIGSGHDIDNAMLPMFTTAAGHFDADKFVDWWQQLKLTDAVRLLRSKICAGCVRQEHAYALHDRYLCFGTYSRDNYIQFV